MTTSPAVRVQLLGAAAVTVCEAAPLLLERKAAGVLTYLALNGPTGNSKLAGLLWPNTREATARNNLAQLKRKFRQALGVDLVTGRDVSSLGPTVAADVREAFAQFSSGRHEAFLSYEATLLDELEYADCVEFHEWLLVQREKLTDCRTQAFRQVVERAEREGDLPRALSWARRALAHAAHSEEAFVHVMRLQYLTGEGQEALDTFAQCERMLKREYDAPPLASTLELARLVRMSLASRRAPPAGRTTLPPALLHPPLLIGREREWALMEEAWAAGKTIFLHGEPGSGKTRLAREFAASKGRVLHVGAKPGDAAVPHAVSTRNLRTMLDHAPRLLREDRLPAWVRRTLSSLMPELAEPSERAPIEAPDPRPFFEAHLEVLRLTCEDVNVCVNDDAHYSDLATWDVAMFIFARVAETPASFPRFIDVYRTNELPPAARSALRQLVLEGGAVDIEVPRLSPAAAAALVASLHLPLSAAATEDVVRATGGHPAFVLEFVKHLCESGVRSDASGEAALPADVAFTIKRRLSNLPRATLRVAQAAAILQSEFSTDLVADVLGAPLLDVASAWRVLEEAQLIGERHFTHDLVYEGVLSTLTPGVEQALHRSAARVLARHDAQAARVARHWLDGGMPEAARPYLLRAAEDAERHFRFEEARAFRARAGSVDAR